MEQDTRFDPTSGADLQLDDGVELLGKYRGSGLQEAPYLLRRGDGQVVQVSRLLYLIAAGLDARHQPEPDLRTPEAVATRASTRFGQEVTAENVTYLVDNKLRPAGLIAGTPTSGSSDTPPTRPTRANPLLALRMRLPVIPERAHRVVTTACEPLFRPQFVISALVSLVMVDAWLVFGQRDNLNAGVRQVIYQPQLLLGITLLTIAAGAFHEVGHAAAARYGGATPGAMGAGIYLVWPVFYTDVTDSYRLDRTGRLRTDLGGVYFNVLFALAVTAVYLQTGFRPLLVFLVVIQLETLRQFLPFVRLDGYYVVSDLAGVPNLFAYMHPVLVTLLRRGDETSRRAAQAKLDELNPRARALITGWVCLTAPVLLVNIVGFLVIAPRLAGAAWGSAAGQLNELTTNGHIDPLGIVNGLVGLTLLALPVVGMSYVFARLSLRVSFASRTWWHARPLATATIGLVVVTLMALQVAVEWPDTFASAFQNAQVAQAIEEAHDEGRADELAGTRLSPPASPTPVGAVVPAAPETTAPESIERDGEVTSGSTGRRSTAGGHESSTSTTGADSPTTEAVDPSPSTATTDLAPMDVQPETRDVPRDSSSGNRTTTSTTTSTTVPPAASPNLLHDLFDWLF